jgi:type II secretion system protein I
MSLRANNATRSAGSAGFTILEALVALAIVAVSVPALFGLFQGGLQSANKVRDSGLAVLLAQSKLAGVGVEERLEEGQRSGRFGNGLAWEIIVRRFDDDTANSTPGAVYRLWEITVVVRQEDPPDAPPVSLTTLRLGGRV